MIFRVLIDGEEKEIKRDVPGSGRLSENMVRQEIIDYFLDREGADEVVIVDSFDEV